MKYYANMNSQENGDYEIHKQTYSWLPNSENRIYLGKFDSCGPAKRKAKEYYSTADGCFYCSKACHTS